MCLYVSMCVGVWMINSSDTLGQIKFTHAGDLIYKAWPRFKDQGQQAGRGHRKKSVFLFYKFDKLPGENNV